MRLDFLIAGAQKSGTTTLRHLLAKNWEVVTMSRGGELHFFDNERIDWDNPDYDAYHTHFFTANTPTNPGRKRGESTPIYLYWRPSISRIHAYNPDIQLIILLRNPMLRAFSQWSMERNRNRETLTFAEAIRSEEERCALRHPLQDPRHSYLDRGRYFEQLKRVYSFFPPEQVLAIKAEEFFQTPDASLDRIGSFLGCPLRKREREHRRGGIYGTALEMTDWLWMYERLGPDICQLETLLGWNCRDWHTPPLTP
jgi:hypothetical protein